MRYTEVKLNDIVNSDGGINISIWTQGCPHRCKECFNPTTWSFNTGKEYNEELGVKIAEAFDIIYLVKSEVTKYLELGLKKKNKEYYVCDKFIEAYNDMVKNKDQTIDLLIENDVPDIYKEG